MNRVCRVILIPWIKTGIKKPPTRIAKKHRTTSQTDPDGGYINHGNKRGIGYLMEATLEYKYGILTGVDVYPANEKKAFWSCDIWNGK